jgi:nucleoside-diphosphate-sugar epimerase
MSAALVGHTGFVGSNLARQHRFEQFYNSRNIGEVAGQAFDLLVFAGAQSKKWWSNANPDEDWAGIRSAIDAVAAARAKKAVLISTIDVIPVSQSARGELADCDTEPMQPYGRHRRALEKAFVAQFPGALIVRLPALSGPGLKKNVLYDLLNDNILDKINPASSFQYYDLTRLWRDITLAMDAKLGIVHLFPEPVATKEIVDRFFPGKAIGSDPAPAAHYDYRTRHGALFGGGDRYIEDAAGVLARLGAFFRTEGNAA